MRLIWTDEEVNILKRYYPTATNDELLSLLPRFTLDKIRAKASKLGIKRKVRERTSTNNKMKRWSEEDIEKLKHVYSYSTNDELVKMFPDYNLRQIRYKARSLNLEKLEDIKIKDQQSNISKMLGDSEWTKDEVNLLKQHYETMGGKGIQKLLPNRSITAIRSKATKLGLTTELEAQWEMTDFKFSSSDIFSIQVQFERVDR